MDKKIFVFGYNKQTDFLIGSLKEKHFFTTVIVPNQKEYYEANAYGFVEVIEMDMTDDTLLANLNAAREDDLICVMQDNHFNVFLTLSLHALYPNNRIIALSNSFHTTQKLKIAGASKVIDLYQVSSNRIYNILHKPVATHFIDSLLSFNEELSLREITITPYSVLDEVMVDDFDFSKHKIILIGMIDRRLSEQFLFITSGLEHRMDRGDVLVCLGYDEDLNRFESFINRS